MKFDGKQILDLPMGETDAGVATVRLYLRALLHKLWRDGEGFNGKRPFGNSGWEWDLYRPLVIAKVISGSVDADGQLEEFDESAGNAAIFAAIEAL